MCASFNNVEHTCQQCGAAVEDGRPFCPHCRAPQIHVHVEAPETGDDQELRPVDVFPSESPAETKADWLPRRSNESGGTFDRSIAGRAALKAGVLGIFVSMIPLLGIVLTGALAVYFYHRWSRTVTPPAIGARLGGAAGLVVFAVSALLVIAIVGMHAQQQCVDMALDAMRRFGLNTADPEIQARFHNVFTLSGQVTSFLFTVVPASIGGALASLFFRNRIPRE